MPGLNEEIIAFLNSEGIEFSSAIPFDVCKVINQRLLGDFAPKSVVVMLVPYYVGDEENSNISVYSMSKDYHLFFRSLFTKAREKFCDEIMCFADHSPIAEVDAAAKAHLGVIGRNNLLINSVYGSYVFIGEIYTKEETDNRDTGILYCENCEICKKKCPSEGNCLSAITHKKGALSDDEITLMTECGYIWGCDICQKYCPHNRFAKTTPIEFFTEDRITNLSGDVLENLSDDEFKARAFAWRGKKVVERNIKILGEEK